MFGIQHFQLFALSVLLINISPGATFATVTNSALTKGFKAGIITAIGAACGLVFYAAISWAGLATLIANSSTIFNIIRYAGVAYLFYCGIKAFLQKPYSAADNLNFNKTDSFKKGLFVNLLNPLCIVLFVTLIPQFINKTTTNTSYQILFMSVWIICSAFTVNTIYAFLFSWLGKKMAGNTTFYKCLQIVTGIFFIYLAVKFAGLNIF